MPRTGVSLAVTGAMLVWVGLAFAAQAASPPAGAFSGTYKVTVRTTNAKLAPSRWIYDAHPKCPSRCHAVSFRLRLASEKSWRKTIETFRWNGKTYAYSHTFPKFADCRAKNGSTVKKGYDVVGKQQFRTRTVSHGRVTRWSGTGKDAYLPNAAGRSHHCTAGAYLYTLNGVAQ